jgi:hypothetical protein
MDQKERLLYALDPDLVAAARDGRDMGDERAAWVLVDEVLFASPIRQDGLVGKIEVAETRLALDGAVPIGLCAFILRPIDRRSETVRRQIAEAGEAIVVEVMYAGGVRAILSTVGLSGKKASDE